MAGEARENPSDDVDVVEETADGGDRFRLLKTIGRWLLFVFGVGGLVYLVHDAGPEAVWTTLLGAGVFIPFIMLCEIGFVGMDVVSLRLMFGERARGVPLTVWLRSAMMAYGIMILLPAGRAGGEVMRAANLAPYIGGARAAAGAALLQGVTLWGNTLISIPCYLAVAAASGPTSTLALLVAGNGVATGVLGSVLLFGARMSRIGGWLGRRVKALANHGAHFDESLKEMNAVPTRPIAAALGGRLFQSLQYGLILLAVGGALSIGTALVSQAIHLVGAGLGDMVPNQMGITEGAYRVFLDYLPALTEAQAIGIALVHRVCQFLLAGTSLAIGALWRPAEASDEASAIGAGEGAA